MIITLGRPYAISEKGRRANNEDSIFPISEHIDSSQKMFLVCDGVGGARKGEIASALACESFQVFFSTFIKDNPTPELIKKAVRYTETRFDEYVATHPEAEGMATTLTMVYLGENGITTAHIGDSRIYQFRKGKPIFHTQDHSLVNSWVKMGKITEEEALHHPKKNVITRAIQGSTIPVEPEITLLTDIEPKDCILMCTDGVTECLPDKDLSSLFTSPCSPENVKNTIVETCSQKAHDNYSFYIIPISNVQNTLGYKQFILSFFYSFV